MIAQSSKVIYSIVMVKTKNSTEPSFRFEFRSFLPWRSIATGGKPGTGSSRQGIQKMEINTKKV